MHRFTPDRTTWHITFGTYGTRLHGGERPTVDRTQNQRNTGFIDYDPELEGRKRSQMIATPLHLTRAQQLFIQEQIPGICRRGGWLLRACSSDHDHVHVLLDVDPAVHGEQVRRLLKRWLTQALETRWPRPGSGRWWAEEGSNKPVTSIGHLNRAIPYIENQRAR